MSSLKFLGGCREVGRSAVLLDTGSEKILIEYGIKLSDEESEDGIGRPENVKLNLDGVLLTHCHLDHSGLIPKLYNRGFHGSVYATATTFDLAKTLWEDSIKIASMEGREQEFIDSDIKKLERNQRRITVGQTVPIGNSEVSVYGAGHVPGSSSFLIDTGKKTVLYTGDINTNDTRLMKGADPNYPDVDVLVMETTYSDIDHSPRKELEKRFVKRVKERLAKDGVVIVPSFAIGRSQEILLVLRKHGIKAPIYLDGMSVEATKKILRYPEFLRYPDELKKAYHNAKTPSGDNERKEALEGPSVIVTTAGMLGGGPFAYYIEEIYNKENCSILMTGYQVEGTAGRKLLDTGIYKPNRQALDVECYYELFDFSAHCGRKELFDYVEKVNPKKVVAMHGEKAEEFVEELEKRGYEAEAPKKGDTITI